MKAAPYPEAAQPLADFIIQEQGRRILEDAGSTYPP
jgi:hypothetical protein